MPVLGESVFDDQGLELPPAELLEGAMVGDVLEPTLGVEGFQDGNVRLQDLQRYWQFHQLMESYNSPIPAEPDPERMEFFKEPYTGPQTDEDGVPLNLWNTDADGPPRLKPLPGKQWGTKVDRTPEEELSRGADYFFEEEDGTFTPLYHNQAFRYNQLPDAKGGDWYSDAQRSFLKGERDMPYDQMFRDLGAFHGGKRENPWHDEVLQNARHYNYMFHPGLNDPKVKRRSNMLDLVNAGQFLAGAGGSPKSGYDPRTSVPVGRGGGAPYWAENLNPRELKPIPNQLDRRYRTPQNQQLGPTWSER